MKKAYVGIPILGVAVLFASYVSVTGQDGNNDNSVRVAYFPNIGHAIPIVGMERGMFAEGLNGTEIRTMVFDSGPQVVEALFAGSIDMAYVGPGPAINGYLNSQQGIIIISGAASGGASVILHPDSATDDFVFDGKRIAVPPIGNTQDVSLRTLVSEMGLDTAERGGSVYVYNLPNPDIYTLFSKGDVDAAWVAEPWATILEHELGGYRLFHEEALWPDGEFASVLLVADAGYVSEHPETVDMWIEAHERTASWINENPDAAALAFNEFLDGHVGGRLDGELLRMSLSHISITTNPLMDSVHVFADRAADLGYLGRGSHDIGGIFYGHLPDTHRMTHPDAGDDYNGKA